VRGPYRGDMSAADFEAAGLYDPRAPGAAERLALLEWLASQGATLAQMVAAARHRSLTALAADMKVRPGPRFGARRVAATSGLTAEQVMALSLAIGLPPADADDPVYTDGDAATFRAFKTATSLFGEPATRQFVRVVGSSLARIAEAGVSLFQVNVEGPLRASGGTDLDLAKQNVRAIESLAEVREMLQVVFTAHMERAINFLRLSRDRRSVDTARLAVGFVDLVGFTTLAHRLSPAELAEVIERFEETAYDVATAHDGRVVKLIGDEVMFVTNTASAACDIALTLFERFAGDPAVTPRGGLAYGELLLRGGDYYGPVVNLAARVAQIAVPNELLATTELAASVVAAPFRVEPAGRRLLKGFDEPVALASVTRPR
jgi:class 3 adenylate cyclase